MVELQKIGFAVKTRRNFNWYDVSIKSYYLPMFHIDHQIPRCAYLGFCHRSLLLRRAF